MAAQALGLAGVIWGMAAAGHRDIAGTTGALEHWSSTTPVALSFCLLLLATALAPPWAQWPATNPAVRRLGDISYGVYLWHLLFIGFALQSLHWTPAGTTAAFGRMFGFAFTGAVVAGSLSYYLMERPLIRWARRRSQLRDRRLRPALPAQAGGEVHDDAAGSTSTSPARRRSFSQGLGQDDALLGPTSGEVLGQWQPPCGTEGGSVSSVTPYASRASVRHEPAASSEVFLLPLRRVVALLEARPGPSHSLE